MQKFKIYEKEFCVDDSEMLCKCIAKASTESQKCVLLINNDEQIIGVSFSSDKKSYDILFNRGEARVVSKEMVTEM